MRTYLLACLAVAGVAAVPAHGHAQGLQLDPAPDVAVDSRPIDRSRIGYTEFAFASAQSAGDEVLIEPSFGFGLLTPQVDAGLVMSFASAPLLTGKRRAFSLTPTVGRHLGWARGDKGVYQLYAAARLPIQWRYGADLSRETGYALGLEVGGRMWACSVRGSSRGMCAGLGLAVRYRHHLREFQMDNAVLPAGSSVLSVPITVSFAMRVD